MRPEHRRRLHANGYAAGLGQVFHRHQLAFGAACTLLLRRSQTWQGENQDTPQQLSLQASHRRSSLGTYRRPRATMDSSCRVLVMFSSGLAESTRKSATAPALI